MSNTIEVSSNYAQLLKEGLKEVADRNYKEEFERFDARKEFYKDVNYDGAYFETFAVNGIGDIPKFNGKLEALTGSPGYLNRFQPAEFGAMRQWERKFLDDKRYDVMNDDTTQLGIATARTINKYCAYPFIYATSVANEFMTTEEGKSLCSTTHLTKAPGISTSSGFSNAGTSALTPTNLGTARLLCANIKSPIGTRMGTNFDTLIVPNALAQTAWEITNTVNGLQTTEGTKNYWNGGHRYNVIVWNLLDDYDTNDWYLADMQAMKMNLLFWEKVAAEFETNHDFQSKITSISVYFRFALGFKDWRWLYKATVS